MDSQGVYKQMVSAGVLDPSEVPFDESENQMPEETAPTLPYEYELREAIDFGGQRVERLTISKAPSAGVCLHLPIGGEIKFGHYVPIVSYCTGTSDALIKKISFFDFRKLVDLVSHFLL